MKDSKAVGHYKKGFAPVRFISAVVLATFCSLSAQAAVIASSGALPDVPAAAYHLYNFKVTEQGITTFSLVGDTDPWIGLFSGTNVLDNSTFIDQDDDGGGGLNSFFARDLVAGSYTAWITTHGSFWDTPRNAIYTGHDHTPMSYTLTINGNVEAADAPSEVPEPASLALLGLGLAGFAASRRRQS